MKLTKKDIKAIEDLDWSVEKTGNGYVLENYSPCGGDMVIEAKTKEEIIDYCDTYDAEEEFKVWYGANNGEPSNPGELWQDCVDKGHMYEDLSLALR